jgi:hypothetical protein
MKKLMSVAIGLSLLVPMASFAQATGGSTDKATGGKKATKTKKGHKGGKKDKDTTKPDKT